VGSDARAPRQFIPPNLPSLRRLTFLVCAAILLALPVAAACSGDDGGSLSGAALGRAVQNDIQVGDTHRQFVTYVPKSAEGAGKLPLLLAFHGAGGDPRSMMVNTNLPALAEEHRFIAVAPLGLGGQDHATWNAMSCCGYAHEAGAADVAFVRQVIALLKKNLPIDPNRIYALGYSNGAMFVQRLAGEMADVFAAVAGYAGYAGARETATSPALLPPAPARPIHVLLLHGRMDEIVPYDDPLGTSLSAPESLRFWAAADGCTGALETTVVVEGEVTWETYGGCKNGKSVGLITVEHGTHTVLPSVPGNFDTWRTAVLWLLDHTQQ
jgi:polyhydroxybutyrate depolymerase